MPRVRALISWGGHKVGDEFDASDSDARVLCAADAFGGPKAKIIDRALKPIEPKEPPSKNETIETKRRYLRRDLRAQD